MRRIFTVSAVVAAVLAPVPARAATVTVEAADFKFVPATATLNPGDTLLIKNTGKTIHNAVAEDGSFKSKDVTAGQETSVVVTKPGTISYVCTYHEAMGMKGTVTVGEASGGNAPAAPTPPEGQSPVESEASKATESSPDPQGEEKDESKDKEKNGDEEETVAAADKPPVEKYFPYVAGLLLLSLFPMISMAYRRNMKGPAAARPEAPPAAEE